MGGRISAINPGRTPSLFRNSESDQSTACWLNACSQRNCSSTKKNAYVVELTSAFVCKSSVRQGWDEDQRSRLGRLRRYARQRPAAYRRRVVVLTLIGYSLLFFIFLASVLLISAGPVLGWWLGGAVGALLGGVATVLGALSIRWWGRGTRPPPGIEVSRRELPELFERIDVLQKQLGSSMIHRVYVDEGTSASVLQLPRARVFGLCLHQ